MLRPHATVTWVAAGAAFAVTTAGALLVVAVVVSERNLWFNGYVSEAGVASSAHPVSYRLGIGLLALGQLLFAIGLTALPWPTAPAPTGGSTGATAGGSTGATTGGSWLVRPLALPGWATSGRCGALLHRIVPLTVVLLVLASVLGGVSGAVSCSPGCPLPPHDSPTAADLIHAGTSILSVGLICLAMLSLAFLCPPSVLAVPSRVAAVILVPLVAADGIGILAIGRGHFTGLLERAVLAGAIGWTLVACTRMVRPALPVPSRS